MKCPQCQGELTKSKAGWLCLHCGYSGKATRQAAAKAAKPTARPAKGGAAKSPAESQPVSAAPIATSAPTPAASPILASTQPSRQKPVRTLTLVLVVLAVLAIAGLAYLLPAQAAGRALTKKLGSAQSFAFSGNLSMTGQAFLSVLNSNVSFNGNYQAKGDNNLNYQGLFASRNYAGQFLTSHNQLYSQMTGSDLPFIRYNQGISTYHILPSTWYRSSIDTNLYKYYCETRPDTKYPSPLLWYQALRQIKLRPSPLVEYNQSVNGHSTTHLRGSISGRDLNSAWQNINSSLPDDCQWNNLLSDVGGLSVHYDAWTSTGYDQIKLTFSDKDLGLNGTLLLDLSGYNQAASVSPPATSLDLAGIFGQRAAIQARDYQRRSDIDALNAAVKKYYAVKKTLPASLSKLTTAYIAAVPKDPNGSSYTYTVSKKTYTLSATLEDSGQLYTVTGP